MANIQTSCWLGASGQRRHRNSKWGLSFRSINCQDVFFFFLNITWSTLWQLLWACYACLWGQYKDIVMQCQKLVPSSNIDFSIEDEETGTFCHCLNKTNKKVPTNLNSKTNKNNTTTITTNKSKQKEKVSFYCWWEMISCFNNEKNDFCAAKI